MKSFLCRLVRCLVPLGCLLPPAPAPAFPPAPHHVVFGWVRDEFGHPVSADAVITLETPGGTVLRTKVSPGGEIGANYQLVIPMDAGLTSDRYKPTALQPTLPFRLKVRRGNVEYLPLEMRGDYARLGQPAGRTRIDLTLGEDADGDGVPDAWERALASSLPGASQDPATVNPGDDADHDGLTNLEEYLAGTYAFDPRDGFAVEWVSRTPSESVLEFLAIRGRTYRLEASEDLHAWAGVRFRVLTGDGASPALRDFYAAHGVSRIRLSVPSEASIPSRMFRLRVE